MVKNGDITYIKLPFYTIENMQTVLARNTKERISDIKNRIGADFIINGGFFWTSADVGWKNYSINDLIVDGKSIVTNGNYSNRGIGFTANGQVVAGAYDKEFKYQSYIGGSPNLITDGKIDIDHDIGHNNQRHPRSAIGVTKDSLVLLTVDGRQKNKKGATLKELAEILLNIGVINAINLDGGGSTRLESKDSVLNSPIQDRLIHNAIAIKTRR